MLNVDGNGQSEIDALFIIADETQKTVTDMVNLFRKNNACAERAKVIMSDKDFNERETFTNAFPEAHLLICLYHTFRSFRREITCEKMGISSAQRDHCLEIVQDIAYSKSAVEYDDKVNQLKNTKIKTVCTYFMGNWDGSKEQWVCGFKDSYLNLGETTYRLESTFNKLQSVCTKYSGLMQFFIEFFSFLGSIRNERNHHHIMSFTRKPIVPLSDPAARAYSELSQVNNGV